MYQYIINEFVDDEDASNAYQVDIQHADGSMNALEKNQKIDWLKAKVPENSVKILSNARFLTEGVDVPDLDAVLFLQPRRSEIDIAQAVGRVMRKSPNKDYGYVILPIGVPEGVSANQVLDDNEKYAVVWDILNALRSIDERFDAMINKLELNKKKPDKINLIGIGEAPEVNDETREYVVDDKTEQLELELDENWTELEKAIYGKIVQKVGTTRYWETWSKDVARIAQQHITRINALLESEPATARIFEEFLKSLRYNINDSISQDGAIEMLAQHMITKPVFDALFEEESFALNNPVSQSMNEMVQRLEDLGFNKDTEKLEGFYESVRLRAEGIDNLEAKQTIIVQLYEKFFKEAFPRTTDSLGIVFTPVEVVDFIIQSVNDVLEKHFGKSISDEHVNILDPFTGTGTFVTRLIQSGLIKKEDLLRKYTQEIYANEIVLLSYYIAAINIEETFKEMNGAVNEDDTYYPFEGIVLTDTFEITESDQEETLNEDLFGDNNKRLNRQKQSPITVIIGNPPYSKGQSNENDANKNQQYPNLDANIAKTYVKKSETQSVLGMYDYYVRAFKWASERIKDQGIIGFVTNASFIESLSADGLRKTWYEEFNKIYVLNLRGDARTSGERRRKEGGNVFGSGTRTPIAITILVKDGTNNHDLYYYEVDDYLQQTDKLKEIKNKGSLKNIEWESILPNSSGDWINQRADNFTELTPISDESNSVFLIRDLGIVTNRDMWVTSFDYKSLKDNITKLINNYNDEVRKLSKLKVDDLSLKNIDEYINLQQDYISWSRGLKQKAIRMEEAKYNSENYLSVMYRPFTKKNYYRDRFFTENVRKSYQSFPTSQSDNLVINISGQGSKTNFSVLMTNVPLFMDALNKGRNFPLYIHQDNPLGLDTNNVNISSEFCKKVGLNPEDTFYYVYGVLSSKEYREKYSNNLAKELPRIPILRNKNVFVEAGKKLADLHLNYENIEPYKNVNLIYRSEKPSYIVNKMKFAKKKENGKSVNDKSIIIFNKDIRIEGIPDKAYEYKLNNRSAIEWIMDQYQVKTDKKSGITDHPNDYSDDPKYIFNLLLSIINMSVQTVDLVNSLPTLEVIEE